jgi:DNA-binding NarL/FixJ family response regulator
VRRALELEGFSVCAEASDAEGAVEAALRERPDVCLLDIGMPGGGIAAAEEISAALPRTAVVMLTVSSDQDDLLAALHAGASGYVLKGTDPEPLSRALQRVLDGEFALPHSLVTRAIESGRGEDRGRRFRGLRGRGDAKAREWTALELLGEGLTTAEVAERLAIPRDQVRAEVAALLPHGLAAEA